MHPKTLPFDLHFSRNNFISLTSLELSTFSSPAEMYSGFESDRKKLENELTIRDDSMVNIDLPPISYINEILGTKLYRVENGKIRRRRTWEIIHTLLLILFFTVVNFLYLKLFFVGIANLTVSLIMCGLIIIAGVTTNVFYVKKLYVNFQMVLRLHKNFDWIKSVMCFEPRSFVVLNFTLEFSLIVIFSLIIYLDRHRENTIMYILFYKIDMSCISFVIWIMVVRSRLKCLNNRLVTVFKLKQKLFVDCPGFSDDVFSESINLDKCNIDELHEVYLRLRKNLDIINQLYRYEVCLSIITYFLRVLYTFLINFFSHF